MQAQVELWNDIRVLGEGFEPGTPLAVVIGDDGVGLEITIDVDENGRFDKWLPTSGLQPGYHAVHFTDRASGASWSADVLLYNALRARVVTEVPWVDQPVTVEGSASFAGHEVTVTLRGTDTTVSTTAAADGTFSVQLPTTGLVPGTYVFDVVDRMTGNSVVNNFVLTAGEPQHTDGRVTVVPGNPGSGEPVTVSGTGFEPHREMTLMAWGLHNTAVETVLVGADGTFSVTLPTGHLYPGAGYYLIVTDTVSGQEFLVLFSVPAYLSVAVTTPVPRVGESLSVEGTGSPWGVTVTVRGTGRSYQPDLDEDGTYWVDVSTEGLAPGEHTVAAAEGVDPNGGLGTPSGPAPTSPAPTPAVPEPEEPTLEAPASQAPQRPGNSGALPESAVADGARLPPAQPRSPAAAAAGPPAPAAHGRAAAAAAPPGPAGDLPRTGAGIAHDAAVALSLMLAGAGALGLARRRRIDR
ncbi:LPXTG cell wall anchor domain-containing protein [Kocuria sp. M1R5S2]|uniref:LPXTG cell wall anchor domain-containing protein n=1 Tax=Kocuria rhizosphaerae TaxID=3376285 RepID=UPI0037945786